ncbi:MAG: exosortase [Planctomycetota bacterium]
METTTVVILAGVRDFGRCPVETEIPRGLWRMIDRPLAGYQLEELARVGVKRAVVCIGGDEGEGGELLADAACEEPAGMGMEVTFLRDRMPRGSAGCVKDAVRGDGASEVLILECGLAHLADVAGMLSEHRRTAADMTVFTDGGGMNDTGERVPAGVYVCTRRALDFVADGGYQDIKEQLIPALLRAGKTVRAAELPGEVARGRDLGAYLRVAQRTIERGLVDRRSPPQAEKPGGPAEGAVFVDGDAEVDATARIAGPAAVLSGAKVGAGAVIVGPAVVGRGALVAQDAVVEGSVLWDGASVGPGAFVSRSLLAEGARVAAGEKIIGRSVANRRSAASGTEEAIPGQVKSEATETTAGRGDAMRRGAWGYGLALGAVGIALAWSYSGVWLNLWKVWMKNDNYSSGVLVPFLAAYVALTRRKELAGVAARPCYWGAAIVVLGFAMLIAGMILDFASAERLSLVVVIWGLALLFFGTEVVRRHVWVLAYLLLMLPWPNRLYLAVSLPLQSWATASAVWCLELLGWLAVREGNVIHVGTSTVAVAEACSGLRMLTAFLVVSGLVAMLVRRSFWEKALLLVSSVPIAILCNTLRLTVTAIAFTRGYGEATNEFFHDVGGIAMVPVALAILAGELWVTKRLFVPTEGGGGKGPMRRSERDG